MEALTCTKAHKGTGHQQYPLLARWEGIAIRVHNVGSHIDDGADHKGLSHGAVVGPHPKEGRGHQLAQTVRCYNVAEERRSSCGVNLVECVYGRGGRGAGVGSD